MKIYSEIARMLFENFEAYDVQETRRVSRAEEEQKEELKWC